MGALTLRSFPFELRGWDLEKFQSIDPTDGFGASTHIYISKQQIIQIESNHSKNLYNPWLNDKSRQFFDSIFGIWSNKNNQHQNLVFKKDLWRLTLKDLLKTLYLFEQCAAKTQKTHFFTVVFENLSIEILSLLKIIEQKYSFVKLRRAENLNMLNDLESNFQLNTVADSDKLKTSTICLLLANNPRYEGSSLNLKLKQRYLKGNFKCLTLGSLISLTFPTTAIGTNIKVLQQINEGNNFVCQDFKTADKPLIIFGDGFSKQAILFENVIKMLKSLSLFSSDWKGLNTLNSTLSETGTQSMASFLPLKKKDFEKSSLFYFINVDAQNTTNLQKIIEAKLLNSSILNKTNQFYIKRLFLDQNYKIKNNQIFVKSFLKLENNKKYVFLPTKMFYENNETFISTEGLVKQTNKLITKQKTKGNWKLVRNLFSYIKIKFKSLNFKNSNNLLFNPTKPNNFTNFINFQYYAVEKLCNTIVSTYIKTCPFFIFQFNKKFKRTLLKITNIKTKYWLDDFFTGGKDEYSKGSLVLANCSKILRIQSTNFF